MISAKTPKTDATPVTVVLVDDHISLHEMLRLVLKLEGGYEVVGAASGGLEALKICRSLKPDVVILDLALPELNGTHLVRLLMRESWNVRVVVYTGAADQQLMREALAEGPHGFVRKEDSLPELRAALRAVAGGSRHVSPWASRLLPQKADGALKDLSPAERAVLHMIAESIPTKEIAQAIGATAKTVDHHRQRLRDKLGLHDVASLMRYAVRNRIVQP